MDTSQQPTSYYAQPVPAAPARGPGLVRGLAASIAACFGQVVGFTLAASGTLTNEFPIAFVLVPTACAIAGYLGISEIQRRNGILVAPGAARFVVPMGVGVSLVALGLVVMYEISQYQF